MQYTHTHSSGEEERGDEMKMKLIPQDAEIPSRDICMGPGSLL